MSGAPTPSPETGTPAPEGLRRVLGPFDAVNIVIGAIVGVGIFFSPSGAAARAGSASGALLAWGLGGFIAMLGAFTFAELGRSYPRAGGQYTILRDAFGPLPAFLYVFSNLTAIQAGAAAIIAILAAQNLGTALHGAPLSNEASTAVALALLAALTAVNAAGAKAGALVQNTTVVAKLLALGAVVALAAFFDPAPAVVGEAAATGAPPRLGLELGGLLAATLTTMFAYGGWQQALWMAGEVKDAQRVVPRAILVGVTIVTAVYVAANWAYLDLLGFGGVVGAKALAAEAVGVVLGGQGERAVAVAVAISAIGVLNAQFLAGPRLTFAMAMDGRFFRWFARVSPRTGAPVPAIVALGVVAATALLVGGLEGADRLTSWVVVVDGVFLGLTALALPVLARRSPGGDRRRRLVLGAAVGFFVLEAAGVIAKLLSPEDRAAAAIGLLWIAGSAVVYFAAGFQVPRSRAE